MRNIIVRSFALVDASGNLFRLDGWPHLYVGLKEARKGAKRHGPGLSVRVAKVTIRYNDAVKEPQ